MSQEGPLYPNQQLRAVSLETFFKGHLGFPGKLGLVQDRFAERLTMLFVPNVQPGEASALRPYQLRPADQKESLALAINQATYVSFDYRGFSSFVTEGLEILRQTHEILGVETLERLTYRYDNQMLVQRNEHGLVMIGDILGLTLPDGPASNELAALDVGWTRAWSRGMVDTKITVEPQDDAWCVFKWVIAATVTPGGKAEQLRSTAEAAHNEALRRFEALITDEFRSFLSQTEEST